MIVVGMARYYFSLEEIVEATAILIFWRRSGSQQCLNVPEVSRLQAQGEVGWLRRESSGVCDDRGVVVSLARSGRTEINM